MKISERFNLNKSQAELDFVDINTNTDTPLFIDPFLLGLRNDRWSTEVTLTIRDFFQKLINHIRNGEEEDARELFEHLHEENSTCLGLSNGEPGGKGVGDDDASKIYENILQSRAIETGLIQDLEDNILFIDNFGKDKLSDMTTNIIKKHLIEYTISQCYLHNIDLTENVSAGYYWSKDDNNWRTGYTTRLVIEEKPILLVPKGIVSFSKLYTPERYYNHFILNFLQHEHLRLNSALVQRRKNGDRFVTKKSIEEKYPLSKEFLRQFTLDHPEILEQFKRETNLGPLQNIEISDLSVRQICNSLKARLIEIQPGTDGASAYHNLILGILELLFYPKLINPVKEREIHDGRKRIDISFDNASNDGIFYRLAENMNHPCQYIFIECKNYSSDPANPELDQLSSRFSGRRGRVGFLLCRSFTNKELFLRRCKDTYKDDRGIIIPIADEDIISLLDNFSENDDSYLEKYLSDIIREITIN
jgi:hypothetical protein